MGAAPKSRIGPRRRRLKRTHYKLHKLNLVRCETCESLMQPHVVCQTCGSFRGVRYIGAAEEA